MAVGAFLLIRAGRVLIRPLLLMAKQFRAGMNDLPAGHHEKRQRAYHPELAADKLQHGDEIVDRRRFVKARAG